MRSFIATALIVSISPLSVALAGDQDLPVLGYHYPRTAFYERSPRSLESRMRNAVNGACRDGQQQPRWLCDGTPLGYLRAVYVTGSKSSNGVVCRGETLNLRYYTEDMLSFEEPEGEPVCLPVVCEGETGKYHVGQW